MQKKSNCKTSQMGGKMSRMKKMFFFLLQKLSIWKAGEFIASSRQNYENDPDFATGGGKVPFPPPFRKSAGSSFKSSA